MLLDEKELEQMANLLAEKLNLRRPPAVVPRLMDIAATAVYMGRSVSGVTHLVKKGLLPITKLDGKIQIDRIALDRLIVESTSPGVIE